MDIDISGLREKIIILFNLSPDTDFALTYTDEDNDVVSLVDYDDLHDAAVIQRLNPLRINVVMNTNRVGTFDTGSQSGTSTPVRSPKIRTPLPRISASVEEALKSLPEPLQITLLKLSHDLMSKTASTPALGELMEYFSILGQPRPSPPSKGDGVSSRTPSSVSRHAMELNVTAGQESLGDQVINSKVLANANFVDQSTGNKLKENGGSSMTKDVGSSHPPAAASLDLNMDFSRDERVDNLMDHCPSQVPEPHKPFTPSFYGSSDVLDGEKNKQGVVTSGSDLVVCPQSNCPVNGQMGADLADAVPPGGFYHGHPYKRSHSNYYDSMFRTFHKGVHCDGCGMYPIMGPRFKSKVKENYDLCNICFSEMGNEADYTKIDRAIYRSPRLFKGIHNPHPRFQSPLLHGIRGCGHRPGRAKLESCFIQDVTVLDGTLMAPATPFIKIWRMFNNGTVAWPSCTQLMWIGGDKLGNRGSVELEIPGSGCPVNKELDVAVDFIAPSQPGRYISYWRMASPSGQRFGQRVWVLIQVDNSQHDSLPGSFHSSLNLNLPPESNGQKGHGIIDVNAEPIPSDLVKSKHSIATPEIVKPLVDAGLSKSQKPEFQVAHGLLAGDGVAQPIPETSAPVSYPIIDFSEVPPPPPNTVNGVAQPIPEISSLVSYPIIDFSKLPPPPPPPPTAVYEVAQPIPPASYPIIDFSDAPPPPTADMTASSSAGVTENTIEETLLKELEEMGFRQLELNKEILRKNKYDMEKSLDDLCDVAEWDPILVELQEMGFADRQMNKKLLVKNGGSIKRVVLHLIAAENEEKPVQI
ncbi:ubiquitin-associated (UBA)/TS-N domain-containing protein / octicosapeptide/Phox/Bemp1 (PB1) domain-containing protein isoform X2 [Tasmannia lanceolata]